MAITVWGVDSEFELTYAAKQQRAQSLAAPREDGVLSGFVVSVATGSRLVSVSAGEAVAPFVLIESDAAETVTLDANTSGNPRTDVIVLEVNWSGSSTTAGDVKYVKGTPGTSPVAPTLTRDAGSVWQIPLAEVRVVNGAAQLVAGNLTNLYPQVDTGYIALSLPGSYSQTAQPLAARRTGGRVEFGGGFRRAGAANVAVGTVVTLGTLPEPFWPSRTVQVDTSVNGSSNGISVTIGTDGVVVYTPNNAAVVTNDLIRVHTTWIPAED